MLGTSCDGFNCVRWRVRWRVQEVDYFIYWAKSNFAYGGWHTDSMVACCMCACVCVPVYVCVRVSGVCLCVCVCVCVFKHNKLSPGSMDSLDLIYRGMVW